MIRAVRESGERRNRGERGAVIIEFALVIPIFMLLVLGLADFALAELSDTAGSNAAREGARVGILYYDGASSTGSTNFGKIEDAVRAKLASNIKGAPTVAVRCLDASSMPKGGSGVCTATGANKAVIGQDLIEVSVTWARRGGITKLIGSATRTDRAVMRIVGTPPTGSAGPAPSCTITAASANPSTVVRDASGAIPAIRFAVTVSDRAACGGVDLTFPAESGLTGPQTMNETSPGGAAFELDLAAGGSWSSGGKTVGVSSNGGAATASVSFTVESPTVCGLTATSPVNANQTAGKLTAPATFNVSVSSIAACGTPTLTFPAAAGYGGPQTMTSAGGNAYAFTVPITQGTWASQTYAVGVAGNNGAIAGISFVVSDAPVCSLTNLVVNPNPADNKNNGQLKDALTISVVRSSTTLCAVPAVSITAPSGSGSGPMTCDGLTCTRSVLKNDGGWGSPGQRTVTVTASGSTVSVLLNLS